MFAAENLLRQKSSSLNCLGNSESQCLHRTTCRPSYWSRSWSAKRISQESWKSLEQLCRSRDFRRNRKVKNYVEFVGNLVKNHGTINGPLYMYVPQSISPWWSSS